LTMTAKTFIPSRNRGGDKISVNDLAEMIMFGSILCQKCGSRRRERVCPKCGYDACLIRLSVEGKYVRIYHDKSGRTLAFTDAFQTLANINAEIKSNTFDVRDWLQPAIQEQKFSNKYLAWLKQKKIEADKGRFSKQTYKLYEIYYRCHYKPLYDLDVRDIKLRHLQEFVNDLNGLSDKYTKNLLDCLKTFFRWLNRWEKLEMPIMPEVEVVISEPQHAITYEEQVEAIKNFPDKHQDIMFFYRETGLRVGEVCAVQVRDLDLANGKILIQRTYSGYELVEKTKGKNKKWIPLSELAYSIAAKHADKRFGNEFLFINPNTGKGYKPSFLRQLWYLHGVKGLKLYEATRHSTISDWATQANAFQVMDLARHSDIRTSQKYVHNAMTDLRKIVNRRNLISLQSDKNPIDETGG
jgi:integrase/ribosomal protein L32